MVYHQSTACYLLVSFLFMTACGTKVEVGRNTSKAEEKARLIQQRQSASAAKRNKPSSQQAEETEADVKKDETQNRSQSIDPKNKYFQSSSATQHLCFGAPEQLDSDLAQFCSQNLGSPTNISKQFSRALNDICQLKKFTNLIHQDCAYPQSSHEGERYPLILEGDRNPSNPAQLSFYGVFATKLGINSVGYSDLIRTELLNPVDFAQKYNTIPGFEIMESVKHSQDKFYYYTKLASSIPVAYGAMVEIKKINDNATVIFEYVIDRKRSIAESRYLRIIKNISENTSIMLAIDEKLVDDLKRQDISLPRAISTLNQRMQKDYKNSMKYGR